MNSALRGFLAATALAVANAHAPTLASPRAFAACAKLPQPASSAQILHAIGDGRMPQLVACGMDPDIDLTIDGVTTTPLQQAAIIGRPELVRQIVRTGARPDHVGQGDSPVPPLDLALTFRNYEAAMALLALGARADYRVASTRTNALVPLAFDDRPGDAPVTMARELIRRGTAVDAADRVGQTALHWSARTGHAAITQVLLDHGADACLRTTRGLRPADLVKTDEALRRRLAAACTDREQHGAASAAQ